MPEPDRTADDAEGRPLAADAADAPAPAPGPEAAVAEGAAPSFKERRARFHERRAASGRHVPAPWFRLRGQTAVKLAVVLSFVILVGVMVAKKVRNLPGRGPTLAKKNAGGQAKPPPETAIPPRKTLKDPADLANRPPAAAPARPAPQPNPLPDLPTDPPAEVVQVDHSPVAAPLAIPDPPAPAAPEPATGEPATDVAAANPATPGSSPDLTAMPDLPEGPASAPTPAPPVAQAAAAPRPEVQAPAVAPEPVAAAPPSDTPPAADPVKPDAPAPAAEVAMPSAPSRPREPTPAPAPAPAPAPTPAPAPVASDVPGPLDLGATPVSVAAVDGRSPIELARDKDRSPWVPLPNAGPRRKRTADPVAPADPASDAPPARAPSPADPKAGSVLHVVRDGEDFGTIARDYYTSSRFRKALWDFNKKRVPSEDALAAGTTLVIPMPEALDSALVAPPGAESVATRGRGRAAREANPREVELMLPVARPATEPVALDGEPARRPSCVVHPGETLRSIARETLGDPHREGEILDLNRRKIPDPRHLTEGLRLALPDDADTGRRLR